MSTPDQARADLCAATALRLRDHILAGRLTITENMTVLSLLSAVFLVELSQGNRDILACDRQRLSRDVREACAQMAPALAAVEAA